MWLKLTIISLCLKILWVKNSGRAQHCSCGVDGDYLGDVQLTGLYGPRWAHPMSATLVEMARKLSSAGTSTRVQNHRHRITSMTDSW